MRNLFARSKLLVAAGQAVSGIAPSARLLTVIEGRVWITVEGAPDDHWLGAGQSLEVGAGRLVVIESGSVASCIALAQPAGAKPGCLGRMAHAIPLHNS